MRVSQIAAAVMLAAVSAPAHALDLPIAPNPALTPGVADPAVTQANIHETICVHGYTARVRHVSGKTKHEVYAEYGLDPHGPGRPFEVDHLISLELGGSNAIGNLWPESYSTEPLNAHTKDALEDRLHALVCHDELPLIDAQRAIATDWVGAYKKFVGLEN